MFLRVQQKVVFFTQAFDEPINNLFDDPISLELKFSIM